MIILLTLFHVHSAKRIRERLASGFFSTVCIMDYVIAIPSYKRSKICNARTLTTLHNHGIPKQLITIFVVDDDLADYQLNCNPDYYGELIVGEKGLVKQREYISRHYPEKIRIISLDDDIESIDISMTEFDSLDSFFRFAFAECERLNAYIWSVYPVFNPFFRKDRKDVSTNLSYLIGAFYGYINRRTDALTLQITRDGNKEDVERSILYYLLDGIVLRFNKVGFKTKYYGTDGGGLGRFKDRLESMKRYALELNERYPALTRVKVRKNGMYEVVFKRKSVS